MALTRRADVMASYDRAWQMGVLVSLTAGIVQIFAGARPDDAIG